MTKIPNPKPVSLGINSPSLCFGHWILGFAACALKTVEICLELGAWNLEFCSFRKYVPVPLVNNS
jgi:hypothetical protein